MLGDVWNSFTGYLAPHADALHSIAELVKILGALASFYALLKLRQIERRYLFKATIPGLIENIDSSLQALNDYANDPRLDGAEISAALNNMLADVKAVRQRSVGDSRSAAKSFLNFMRPMGFEPRFWQRQAMRQLTRGELFEIYGRGVRLIRFLENELSENNWSSR
ncbi:MAG TPA: hypothetical protein VF670_11405 [Duganella sp.]|jgi:hypothetical protein